MRRAASRRANALNESAGAYKALETFATSANDLMFSFKSNSSPDEAANLWDNAANVKALSTISSDSPGFALAASWMHLFEISLSRHPIPDMLADPSGKSGLAKRLRSSMGSANDKPNPLSAPSAAKFEQPTATFIFAAWAADSYPESSKASVNP
jgi:hypothetical protein